MISMPSSTIVNVSRYIDRVSHVAGVPNMSFCVQLGVGSLLQNVVLTTTSHPVTAYDSVPLSATMVPLSKSNTIFLRWTGKTNFGVGNFIKKYIMLFWNALMLATSQVSDMVMLVRCPYLISWTPKSLRMTELMRLTFASVIVRIQFWRSEMITLFLPKLFRKGDQCLFYRVILILSISAKITFLMCFCLKASTNVFVALA